MIDQGTGSPVVLIPGIQGRVEWMQPTIDALSARHRVLGFSLNDEAIPKSTPGVVFRRDRSVSGVTGGKTTPGVDFGHDPFAGWVATIDALLDRAGLARAAIVGISFGGIVATHYAALRPERVSALVLTSSPSPRWRPTPRVARDLQHPILALPGFIVRATSRVARETISAIPGWAGRIRFGLSYAVRAIRFGTDPRAMAGWVRAWMAMDIASECPRVLAPTLVVTGEPNLDQVVPVSSSLEYLQLIAGARAVTLHETGHVGCVSKPMAFAKIVAEFVGA